MSRPKLRRVIPALALPLTLLIGVDKDTSAAYLYAVGHATGPSTVIQLLGKLPGTYTDPIYFLRTHGTDLHGE